MSPRPIVFFACSLLMIAACKDREITAYQAPKDPPPPAMPGKSSAAETTASTNAGANPSASSDQSMANTAVPTASSTDLSWTAPAHWTAKPASAMRKGSFAIKDDTGEADLSITAFPGSTGGLLANLNRWRSQIGMTPLADAELHDNAVHLDVGELHLDVVDFAGTAAGKPTRIIGAVVPYGTNTWFFKLMGPDALVAQEKAVFLDFLRTIKAR